MWICLSNIASVKTTANDFEKANIGEVIFEALKSLETKRENKQSIDVADNNSIVMMIDNDYEERIDENTRSMIICTCNNLLSTPNGSFLIKHFKFLPTLST